jgi:hypothetical protein
LASETAGLKLIRDLVETGPNLAIKWFMVVGLVMYCLFAVVVIKQVGIMSETFESNANGTVKTIAWLHLGLALILTLIAVVI